MTKKIEEIISKYQDVNDFIVDRLDRITDSKDCHTYFTNKWRHHVEENWYGFSCFDIPKHWINIVDDFLDYIKSNIDPDFKILQIKLKFGGMRLYLKSNEYEKIREYIVDLEKILFDERLIY